MIEQPVYGSKHTIRLDAASTRTADEASVDVVAAIKAEAYKAEQLIPSVVPDLHKNGARYVIQIIVTQETEE